MATAAELLAARMSGVSDDKTLIIDNYLRMIQIPPSITTLGVENDDDVLRLRFRMPRYLDTTDLSTFSIRINYLNAQGESDVYDVSDMVIAGEYLTFSWLVGPTATRYKGKTKFNVCMRIVDSEFIVQQEYNTTIATLPVLEGLECDEGVIEGYSDILEQWKAQLFGIGDTEEAKLLAKSEEEQQKIVDKAVEVLATIPEDYTTTYNMAEEALRKKANAIILETEGEAIFVNDASDSALLGLRVFGKTTQTTTTGAQLADFTGGNVASGVTKSFIYDTLTVIGDGTLSYQSWSVGIKDAITDHPGEILYFDYEKLSATNVADGTVIQLNISKTDGTKEYIALVNKLGERSSYTIPDDTSIIENISLAVYTTNASTAAANTITIVKPMLQFGTDAKEYEPYTGCMASPSPEYPQDIVSAGSDDGIVASVFGSNLFDVDSVELTTNTSFTVSDDGYTITAIGGTANIYAHSGYRLPAYLLDAIRGRTVYLAADSITTDNENAVRTCVQLNIILETGSAQYASVRSGRLAVSADIPENVKNVEVNIYTSNYGTKLTSDVTGVFKGLRLTILENAAWEPYKKAQTLTMQAVNGLPGIPVDSGGNYTDANGQQWICDEIDFERGVYVQRIYDDLAPTTGWQEGKVTDTYYEYKTYSSQNRFVNGKVLCTHFRGIDDNRLVVGSNRNFYARFPISSGVDTVDKAAAFFASGEVYIAGILLEPVETPLTDEEIANFKMVCTNYHNTTVLNDAGAHMVIKYNADTLIFLRDNQPPVSDERLQAYVDEWLTRYFTSAEGVSF